MPFPSRDWSTLNNLNEEETAVAQKLLDEKRAGGSILDYTDWEELDDAIRSALKIPYGCSYHWKQKDE